MLGRHEELAAARARPTVFPLQDVDSELIASQRSRIRMMQPAMLDVFRVIRDAEDGPEHATDAIEHACHGVESGWSGTRAGRVRSNISKIRRYSSVHDDGRTKA
jgi:hypothetical protein